jgi:hypothetical protein
MLQAHVAGTLLLLQARAAVAGACCRHLLLLQAEVNAGAWQII